MPALWKPCWEISTSPCSRCPRSSSFLASTAIASSTWQSCRSGKSTYTSQKHFLWRRMTQYGVSFNLLKVQLEYRWVMDMCEFQTNNNNNHASFSYKDVKFSYKDSLGFLFWQERNLMWSPAAGARPYQILRFCVFWDVFRLLGSWRYVETVILYTRILLLDFWFIFISDKIAFKLWCFRIRCSWE